MQLPLSLKLIVLLTSVSGVSSVLADEISPPGIPSIEFLDSLPGQLSTEPEQGNLLPDPATVGPNVTESDARVLMFPKNSATDIVLGDLELQTFPAHGSVASWNIDGDTINVESISSSADLRHTYSRLNAIDSSNTFVVLYSNGSNVVRNLKTGSEVVLTSDHVGRSFSTTRPGILFGLKAGKWNEYDAVNNKYTEFSAITGSTVGQGEGRPSHDGSRVALREGSNIVVYDLANETRLMTMPMGSLNWFGVSSSGDYLIVDRNPNADLEVYDVASGHLMFKRQAPGGSFHEHADVGVDSNGDDIIVFIGYGDPYWCKRQPNLTLKEETNRLT